MKTRFAVAALLLVFFTPTVLRGSAQLGVNPDDTEAHLKARYGGLCQYLATITGEPAHDLVVAPTYEALEGMLVRGEISLAVVSPLNYVRFEPATRAGLVARIQKYGVSEYGSVILVRRDQIPDISKLGSRTFVHFSGQSTSGYLYPLALLKDLGVSISKHKIVEGSHFDVIKAIADGDMLFGATSTDKIQEAEQRSSEIPIRSLYALLRGPVEIPFDAIVVSPKLSRERAAAYRRAIGQLITMATADIPPVFGGITGITGVVHAKDGDYDVVRKVFARADGAGVLRIGLSANVETSQGSRLGKLEQFRGVIDCFFRDHKAYLDVRFFDRDDYSPMLAGLQSGELDIAELPPIPAGRALRAGCLPLVAPEFNGKASYTAVLIKHKQSPPIRYADGLLGKTVAVLSEWSASGYAYRICDLRSRGIELPADALSRKVEPYEVIEAVANDRAEVGAIAKYQLDQALAQKLPGAALVEIIEASAFEVPNGAYVLSARSAFGKSDKTTSFEQLSRWFLDLPRTGDNLPFFAPLTTDAQSRLVAVVDEIFPPNRKLFWLLLIAAVLVAVSGVVFLTWQSRKSVSSSSLASFVAPTKPPVETSNPSTPL